MADNTIKIGGELESMATGKIVAAASAIKDKSRNKTQEVINGDVEAAIAEQSAQFEALLQETSAAVASASESARESKQYLADLQEAITELPDGQAVSAQVAVNEVDIAGLKSDVVVDLSTRYATSYANLSAALTALNSDTATDAAAIKKSGVSIKFINSSTNKYEQWNLKASSWSVNTSDWVKAVDSADIPIDKIESGSTQSEEDAIVFETDGGVQVGKIDSTGADFTNLKRGGQQVARMSDLPTVPTLDTSIDSSPSNSHTPSTKAVKDYVDDATPTIDTTIGNDPTDTNVPSTKAVKNYVDGSIPDYPIDEENTESVNEEVIFGNDAGTQQYVKVSSEGVRAVAYNDMQGNNVIPVKDTSIGENPSTTNVPTSKAVADYVSQHGGGNLPISRETAPSETEETIWADDENTEEYVKIGDYGIKAKGFFDINGNLIFRKYITCWGDSITMGWQGRAYSEVLQDNFPNIKVYNCGVGGETNTTIMARLGAINTLIQNSFVLPASTSSRVEIANDNTPLISSYDGKEIKPLKQGTGGTDTYAPRTKCNTVNPCYVGGIECTMEYSSDKWYIKRNNAGTRDITFPANTSVVFNGKKSFSTPYASIFFAYQNGGVDSAQDLVEKYRMMVNECNTNKYLVLNKYTSYTSINATYEEALREAFGVHFFNVREYLATNALYDLGITPTTDADLTNAQIAGGVDSDVDLMSEGKVPSTFWRCAYRDDDPVANTIDNVHMNALGYQAMGNKIAELLISQGV